MSSIAKESKNIGAKKLNNDIIVDAGFSIWYFVIGKKIEK